MNDTHPSATTMTLPTIIEFRDGALKFINQGDYQKAYKSMLLASRFYNSKRKFSLACRELSELCINEETRELKIKFLYLEMKRKSYEKCGMWHPVLEPLCEEPENKAVYSASGLKKC